MNARIIPASELYRDKLTSFMHQKYSTYSDAYIEFEVNEAISNAKDPKSRRAYLTTIREYFARVKMFLDLLTNKE